jgi:WD40 repeat protein
MNPPPGSIALEGHQHMVKRVVSIPLGNRIATASGTSIRVFSGATGQLEQTCDDHRRILGLAALGGNIVASGGVGGGLRLWDVSTGANLYGGAEGVDPAEGVSIQTLAAVDDTHFVAGLNQNLLHFTHNAGNLVTLSHEQHNAHADNIYNIAVGNGLIVSAAGDQTPKVWDARETHFLANLVGHVEPVDSVAIGAQTIVTCCAGAVLRVFKVVTFQNGRTFHLARSIPLFNADVVEALVIVQDDRAVTTHTYNHLRVTNLATGQEVSRTALPSQPFSLSVFPERRIVVGCETAAYLLP